MGANESAWAKWARYWRRYALYVIVASAVGIATIGIREVLALLFDEDSKFNYGVSVLVAYACGIVMSFFCQARITFRQSHKLPSRFSLFVAMAIVSAFLTVMISRFLRYEGNFDHLFGAAGAGLAFGLSAIATSLVTYVANARFVFDRETSVVTQRE